MLRGKIAFNSNSMSHGLSARSLVEQREEEVKSLAVLFATGVPYTDEVQKAAQAVADALFARHAIQRARLDLLTPGATGPTVHTVELLLTHLDRFDSYTKGELLVLGEELFEDFEGPERSGWLLFDTFQAKRFKLRSMDEYERKAHSRYLKLVSRLDYVIIEALRKT